MRRVFLSFLGIGAKRGDHGFGYDPARYILNDQISHRTEFVQAAEIELLGPERFDEILMVATARSRDLHFRNLESQLVGLGAKSPACIEIEEDMSAEGQWRWFEKILDHVQLRDHLTVDLTHGYRAIPIVFSTAVSFLQRAKRIVVESVFYGAYEKDRELAPIIDMKDFYIISEWAEGVSRLVEDADARKLAELTRTASDFQAGALNDVKLIGLLDDLTNRIRNVDMHNVGRIASETLGLIQSMGSGGTAVGQVLLGLIHEKYAALAGSAPGSGKYDHAYFQGQLAYIDLLLEHRLYMQAFTVMREVVGSIGLIENPKARLTSSEGRKQRGKAEVFINMLQHDESVWSFGEKEKPKVDSVLPFYRKLEQLGVLRMLTDENLLKPLLKYRNGFDHGWTSSPESFANIAKKGEEFSAQLGRVVSALASLGIL
jgi:hypothetical protein